MLRCIRFMTIPCLLLLSLLASSPVFAQSHGHVVSGNGTPQLADFPTVDPNYIYDQLSFMATSFPHREAGYDNNLPVNQNGHDEFASYWTQEITKDLQGFNPQVRNDQFHIDGWDPSRPAVVPAFNVEVSIQGKTTPQEIVVIGCHYDGMSWSTQSAFDDASGCAIELGVAKAMATYWSSHHTAPARTIRFVIFDAEEQGILGSDHYVNTTIKNELGNVIAMINEEQNGIGYPIRYQGNTQYPVLPFFNYMTPLDKAQSDQQHTRITHFRDLMDQSYTPVFAQFQALGYTSLTDQDSNGNPVTRPIFGAEDLNNIQSGDDTLGSSDQVPFTDQGIACATLVTNHDYYDAQQPWSYPFDRPEDTIQLMNQFASGKSDKAQAIALALALPGMITTWVLNQPDMLGQASS